MNSHVRSYLIAIARQPDQFIAYSDLAKYCKLRLDLNTLNGQKQLSTILGEVSAFEHAQGRPLITALAIYKDPNKNDHGSGFYRLAEQLGIGTYSKLKAKLWGFEEANECRKFWQNDDKYKQFADLKPGEYDPGPSLTKYFKEMLHSTRNKWAVDWKNSCLEIINDVERVRSSLINNPDVPINEPVHYEGSDVQRTRDFEGFMRRWIKEPNNGIASRGRSVLSESDFQDIIADPDFLSVIRESIITPDQNHFNQFVNWWMEQDMNNRPLLINRAFAALAPETLSTTAHNRRFWLVAHYLHTRFGFRFEVNPYGNWYSGNAQLTTWLDTHLNEALSDLTQNSLVQAIWRNLFVWFIHEELVRQDDVPMNRLQVQDKPKGKFDKYPEPARTFKGRGKPDYIQKSKEQKDLGDAGENLVLMYEVDYLQRNGRSDKAELVEIVEDGSGFDVLSFDLNGHEKYIEVKTTKGNEHVPFHLSDNEYDFANQNKGSYFLYRLYHYHEYANSADFFILEDDVIAQLVMRAVGFKAMIKK